MIKVRVTKAGLAGASSFLALSGGLAACAVEPVEETESAETAESGLTVRNPGTGVFELTWAYGTTTGYTFSANNSVDEYVRVGESMKFSVPAYFLWQRLYPNDAMPTDEARLDQLAAKVKVVFVKANGMSTSRVLAAKSWEGAQSWDRRTTTASFNVPKGTVGVRFEMAISDAADATKTATLGQGDFLEVPVVGGRLPDKTLLFDTDYGRLRQRVLEGGNPVSGAKLSLGYTDWRAASLVDASKIDKQIGTAKAYGRFGSFEMPVMGELEYEITCEAAVDGKWQDAQALAANAASRLLPAGRTAYEGSLAVAKGAKAIELVFRVKAYLKVDYSKVSNLTWRKYQDGERILVADRWDNENGAAFDNFDFSTEKR